MSKFFYKFFIVIFVILFCTLVYLSTIGVSTNVFNSNISKQLKKIDRNLDIELNRIFLILNPLQFRINLKTVGANIKYDEEKIQLENITTEVSLKSFLNKNFNLNNIKISTKSLEINKLLKFLRLAQKNPKLYIAEKMIKKGYLIADIKIEFDKDGNLKDNFLIKGTVKNGKINFFKKNNFEEIDFIFNAQKNKIQISNLNLDYEKEKIKLPKIIVVKNNDKYFVSGQLINNQIYLTEERLKKFINLKQLNFKINEINFSSESDFSFSVNKNFRINNLNITSKVDLMDLKLQNNFSLKNFFPKSRDTLILKNNLLKIIYKKDTINISGSGNILFQKKLDMIEYNILKKKKDINFNTKLEIKENDFTIDFLNYKKKDKSNLSIDIKGKKNNNKNYIFNQIKLIENENVISIKDLSLFGNNKINYIKKINLNYKDKNELQNNIEILKKKKNYVINGDSFNINNFVDNLINSKNKKDLDIFKNDFKLLVNIKKIYLDTKNILSNLNGYLLYKNNKVLETELSSKFSNGDSIKFTIKSNGDQKITTLFSNKAKPLVERYKFIKGFDEGKLDFYSIKGKNKSNSTLKIYDFKLKELPALTKILTLASLQGIADLLSGEGIRFKEFEMNFSNQKNLMTIDEIYAIGPAISVLMSGYVEKNGLISLRGTLVPATTLNKTIGSIPFLGNILVGKKTGEGVFGVSFKIKGPPKKLETTVNPIKTLTPRFITRTLEKIKKN